jgi:hypothetical protein
MTFPDLVLDEEFTREVRASLAPRLTITASDCCLAMLVAEFSVVRRIIETHGPIVGPAKIYVDGEYIGDVISFEFKIGGPP